MSQRLAPRQDGMALLIVLAFMALVVPLVTAALGLASTLSIDSRVKTDIARDQYSALGGSQDAIYRIAYETGYNDSLQVGVPSSYTITLNGEEVTVTVLKLSEPASNPPPPPGDDNRRLHASKQVTPTTALPNTLTTFTYTVTVTNGDDQAENLKKLYDGLPAGFSYVPGSTTGVTTAEPSISGQLLTWNLTALRLSLQPQASVALTFQARAQVAEGTYCNEAWADPGGSLTSSGKTAPITVGSPASSLCPGATARLTKNVTPAVAPAGTSETYTYTITIENLGTEALNLSKLRDLLSEGFSYVTGSTSGDITSQDPTTTMYQGNQRLDWNLDPKLLIEPGVVKSLAFRGQASVAAGEYWNEVWATFDEFSDPVYSWPTALVEVMGVFESTATSGGDTAASQIWLGSDSYLITQWNITR